jgi:hypothetical protein
MRTVASLCKGYDRSTICPFTTPASAALASLGEIADASAPTVDPGGTARLDPSGNVTVVGDMDIAKESGAADLASSW